MCGIFGYFSPHSPVAPDIREWAEDARSLLKHRGPDGSVVREFLDGRCILGHDRLSIIDIEGGTQPLSNEDGSVWIIFNGEIYNYIEIRKTLEPRHQFRTNSDTEVLVHLYEEKGEQMLDDLVGMFAFAILDQRNNKLFLARDRFGEKPLYYAQLADGAVAFASELKGLRNMPGVVRDLDVAAIAQYLALGYIPAPRTHLRGVRKLRAGEAAVASSSTPLRTWKYWELSFTGDDTRSENELVEEFQHLFRESVRLRLRSDVPLGAFLSGGIDSTLVVCAMRELLPDGDLRTFCAGFDDTLLDERQYAREIAELVKSRHREVLLDMDGLANELWEMASQYDEPFADYSFLPTFAVCREARRELKVMLSGDGADELFGGYGNHYRYFKWHGVRKAPLINPSAGAAAKVWPKGKSGSGVLTFLGKSDYELLSSIANDSLALDLISPEGRPEAEQGLSELTEVFRAHEGRPYPLSAMEVQAGVLTLPEQMLTKVDRASMKAGLESRTPFLDHRLAEFAARIPPSVNFRDNLGKMLLRKALPVDVSDRVRWRSKRGFTPPMAAWLRGRLKAELGESLKNKQFAGIADPAALKPYFEAHMKGEEDYQDILFRWMVLARHGSWT
jgi:asparagine synthase (glutamine-hydrolysing)